MLGKRSRVNALGIATTSKRLKASRPRGTASQPVPVDTQLSPPSSLSHPLSPRQALVAASQALNFEATLRELRAEDSIVPPSKGSEHATVAASAAGNKVADKENFRWMEDNYDGFDWSRYLKHCRPPTTLST
jgi:hypothetical protein